MKKIIQSWGQPTSHSWLHSRGAACSRNGKPNPTQPFCPCLGAGELNTSALPIKTPFAVSNRSLLLGKSFWQLSVLKAGAWARCRARWGSRGKLAGAASQGVVMGTEQVGQEPLRILLRARRHKIDADCRAGSPIVSSRDWTWMKYLAKGRISLCGKGVSLLIWAEYWRTF